MNEIEEKSVIFKNTKGENLWAVLSLPKGKEKIPAVIAVHGFCGSKSKRKMVKIGRRFAKSGIAVLRFDFSGCGDSEGDFEKMSINQEGKDLKSAYNFLIKNPRINREKIGFLGHSLGALIVCLLQKEKLIAKTLVLVSQALDQRDLMKIWNNPQQIKKWRKQGYLDMPKCRIGVQYLNEARDYTPIVSGIKTPVLIIQGNKDKDVPVRFSKNLLKAFGGEKNMIIVREADHDFESYQSFEELKNHSLRWFKKYL